MTFIEHLEYYATIKGVKPENIKKEIESILKKTKCMGEKDKLAMALSGGNRRKLSLGMALIGYYFIFIYIIIKNYNYNI